MTSPTPVSHKTTWHIFVPPFPPPSPRLAILFPPQANCPYLSLINSHYSLVLPMWFNVLSCDQLLLLDHDDFFASFAERAAAASTSIPAGSPLLGVLQFAGFSADNATRIISRLSHPTPPNFGTSLNPISKRLELDLEAYFAPFQHSLRQLVASHRKCFSERFAAKKSKQKTKMVAR